ncbi:MAG: tetratricopeptide repeat protein [Bacteroidota bacterium]
MLTLFALEKHFFNSDFSNPGIHHFFNVLWYGLAAVMLYLFLLALFREQKQLQGPILPLVITLLFVAHPIHTEVVANIKSRDEILSFFFLTASLYALLRYARKDHLVWLGISLLAFLACVLSKDSGLAMFGLVPFTLYYFTKVKAKNSGVDWGKMAVPVLAFAGTVGFYLLLRSSVMDKLTFEEDMLPINNSLMAAESTAEFLATNIKIHGKYLLLLLFPHPLSYDYSFPQIPISTFADWRVWLSLLSYVALAIYAIRGLLKRDPISYGIIWYVIMMVLTSNFFTIIGAPLAERFLFAPSLGFCLAVTILLWRLSGLSSIQQLFILTKQSGTLRFAAIVVSVLLAYAFKTVDRNADWKNSGTLFSSGLVTAPNSARALASYGSYLRESGERSSNPTQRQQLLRESIQYYQQSLQLYPDFVESRYNMGVAYLNLGDAASAKSAYELTLRLNPDYQSALNNLGFIYFQEKNFAKALEYWNHLLEVNPNSHEALGNIGAIYHTQEDLTRAIDYYERSVALQPNNPRVIGNLIKIYQQLGNAERVNYYRGLVE